jgi:PAS domain S-box-containing protein
VELERELAETSDHLQSIQEQYEAANEELQAANEEVQSVNEELQSINEELETSKEELESANEELMTVNEEMANRNAELNRLNSDLTNLQTSTKLPIVLLARDLTIRRFSAQAEKQFNLLATDVGRPITNVRHNLLVSDLGDFVSDVISQVHEREREIQDKDGRWYSLQVRPYITLDNKVDGAALVLVDIDTLKRSEAAIATARDYTEAIIETVRGPLIVLDEKLRVRTANRAFYENFHVSPEETENRFIYDLGNRQWDIPKLRSLLEEILPHNNQFQDFEVEHEFEKMGQRTMLLNTRRMRADGNGALILLAIEDITKRKRSDEAQKALTEQLELELTGTQRLQKTSMQLIHGGDTDALYRQILDAAIALMHSDMGSMQMFYPERGALRLLAWKGFNQESAAFWECVLPASSSTCGVALNTAQRVQVSDVETCDFLAGTEDLTAYRKSGIRAVQSTPLISRPGKIVGMISTHWHKHYQPAARELSLLDVLARQAADLIERQMAEQAIVNSEERFRSLVSVLTNVPWTTDAEGAFTTRQQAWEAYTGQSWEEYRGFGWTSALHADDRERVKELWLAAVDDRALYESEGRLWHAPSQQWRYFTTKAIPLMDADGKVREWVGTCTDVQDLRLAEEELSKLVRKERAARAEAEAANRVKDEFLAMISHELRTPLNAIVGWTHLLKRGKLDQRDAGRAIQIIDRNATAQAAIINELLDVSRIISGKLKLDMKPVDLKDVIKQSVDVVRPAADAKLIEIVTSLDYTAGLVAGESVRLQQVIWNLLTNAIKFTPKLERPPVVFVLADVKPLFAD